MQEKIKMLESCWNFFFFF